jgi:flagellar basal-body rod protein FlgB
MDLNSVPLFKALMTRMSWLGERQKVLAENVANADTPNYVQRDLKPLDFAQLLGKTQSLQLAATQPGHLQGSSAAAPYKPESDRTAEVGPSGNGVAIEQQMLNVAKTVSDYSMTTELYRQHLSMLKTAIGH